MATSAHVCKQHVVINHQRDVWVSHSPTLLALGEMFGSLAHPLSLPSLSPSLLYQVFVCHSDSTWPFSSPPVPRAAATCNISTSPSFSLNKSFLLPQNLSLQFSRVPDLFSYSAISFKQHNHFSHFTQVYNLYPSDSVTT